LSEFSFPSKLGSVQHQRVRPYLQQILYSQTKEEFDGACGAIRRTFQGNANLLAYFETWFSKSKMISGHARQSWLTLGRRGSSHAEQNHSSWLSRIGFGVTLDPEELLCLCLERQADLAKELNYSLAKEDLLLHAKKFRSVDDALKCCSHEQSTWAAEIFSKEWEQSLHYECDQLEDKSWLVSRDSSARCVILQNESPICSDSVEHGVQSCEIRTMYQCMCRHEIAVSRASQRSGYEKGCFAPRWSRRQSSRVSHREDDTQDQDEYCSLVNREETQERKSEEEKTKDTAAYMTREAQAPIVGTHSSSSSKRVTYTYSDLIELAKHSIEACLARGQAQAFAGLLKQSTKIFLTGGAPEDTLENLARKSRIAFTTLPVDHKIGINEPLRVQSDRNRQKRLRSALEVEPLKMRRGRRHCSFCGSAGATGKRSHIFRRCPNYSPLEEYWMW